MGMDDVRVGDAERRTAMDLLAKHFNAGRLDSFEYEDRRGRAADAVTRQDLDALFADLPPLGPDDQPIVSTGPSSVEPRRSAGRRTRDAVMALVPFVALALFLRTGSWLWFLLIPATAIIAKAVTDGD